MTKNRRRAVSATLGVLLAGLTAVATAGDAAAVAARASSNQSFVGVAHGADFDNRVIAVGPFSGVGPNVALDSTENPDGTFTDTDRFEFPRGNVVFRITYAHSVTTNPLSCVSTSRDEGTYTLIGGTGAFAGISGSGTFTVDGTSVAGREGLRCLGPDTPPVAVVLVLRGGGTTHLPGSGMG